MDNQSNTTQLNNNRGIDTNLAIEGNSNDKNYPQRFNFLVESKDFKFMSFITFHSEEILKNLDNKEGTIGGILENFAFIFHQTI